MASGVIALHPATTHVKPEGDKVSQVLPQYTKDQIIGIWTLNQSIKRRSHNRPDGTASLNVTFDFFTSFIYGAKLNMETDWTLEGDVLTYTITSGEPASSLNRLTSDFGKVASYRILKLTDTELLLQELHGEDECYLWKRES